MVSVPIKQIIERRRVIVPRPGSEAVAGQLDLFPSGNPYLQLYSVDGQRVITATPTEFGAGVWIHDAGGRLRLCCLIRADGSVTVSEIDEEGGQRRLVPERIEHS